MKLAGVPLTSTEASGAPAVVFNYRLTTVWDPLGFPGAIRSTSVAEPHDQLRPLTRHAPAPKNHTTPVSVRKSHSRELADKSVARPLKRHWRASHPYRMEDAPGGVRIRTQ